MVSYRAALMLLLFFTQFFSLNNCAKSINPGYFSENMQNYLSEYLENPAAIFGSLNRHSRDNQYPLKYFVKQRFDIPELDDVDDNDPELQFVLNLSLLANDPDAVFNILVEDVIKGKKPYKTLFAPLVSYLARKFEDLSVKQQTEYFEAEDFTFEHYLFRYYQDKGDYKSAFEAIQDYPKEIINFFNEEIGNPKLMEMFKENPQFVQTLKENFNPVGEDPLLAFTDREPMKARWIFQCVIYNTPEYFYMDLLTEDPSLLISALRITELFFVQVPENEMQRIHMHFKHLLDRFFPVNANNDISNIIVDIRFGSEELFEISTLSGLDNDTILYIARIALISKKKDIFCQIYHSYEQIFIEYIKKRNYIGRLEKLLILSEILTISSPQVQAEIFCNPATLQLALKYYAVKSIKYENGQLIVDFIAPESLLKFDVLPQIRFTSQPSEIFNEKLFGLKGINDFWSSLQVIDEESFYCFLLDYENLPIKTKLIKASAEVIKFIIQSPILIDKVREIGIKFLITKDFLELITFIHNDEVKEILNLDNIKSCYTIYLRSIRELKVFEALFDKSVADLFLSQNHGYMTENDYFRWRLALKYWIKGDQRQRIAEIRSNAIIKLLRTEFHDEMKEILGPDANSIKSQK